MAVVKNISFEPGYIVVTTDEGVPRKYSATRFLQAADIPDLTIDSLTLLTNLAQVTMILVQTLIDKEILDEELVGGFDLQYMREVLVDDLSAEEVY